MGAGRREKLYGKKLNIIKVVIVVILLIIVGIGIYFLVFNKKSNDDYDKKIEEALVKEIEEEPKTIEEIVSEFGGEIKEQIKSDTYYITKEGKDYTAYLDGEIVEGRISLWSGDSKEPAVDEAGNINIYNAEELKWIADQVISGQKNFSGVTVTLRNSIDLGARKKEDGSWEGTEWIPIIGFLDELPKNSEDNSEEVEEEIVEDDSVNITKENLKRFAGIFNGNGFSIRGMYVNSDKRYQGLFGYQAGTIQNLTIKNSNVNGSTGVGAIAGLNSGTIVECKIQNVEVKGQEKIGGFVGISMVNSWIENCSVIGDTSVAYGEKYTGGIVGYTNNNSAIVNCENRVNVTGNDYIGGIVGIVFYGTTIKNCSNLSMNVVGNNYVGGIAGYSAAQIENSYNHKNEDLKGIVSGKDFVGGIVGLNYSMGNITDSYNCGEVIVENDNCGGIAGLNNATISNCYNKGIINASACEGAKIGGICGQNVSESFIYSSYNIGNIKAKNLAQGVVGADFGTISNCFYLNTSLEKQISENENSKTEAEMKESIIESLGDGFKKDTENKNSGYPILNWQ